jgi:myb proto-oncogene protein
MIPWILANGREGKWTAVEDSQLKDAVLSHGDKNWVAIAALVSDRTKKLCKNKWHNIMNPSIECASGRKGRWTTVEDSVLKDAVQTHDDKDWVAISVHVPGRTRKQCFDR